MWKKISKLLFKKDEQKTPSPQEIIDATISEISLAIERNQFTLAKTKENEAEIVQKSNYYENKIDTLKQRITKALSRGEQKKAQKLLDEKNSLNSHFEKFANLHQNISKTVNQLENQIQKLNFQRQEIRAKQTMLNAQLETAKTQKNLNQSLSELEETYNFDLFEDEVIQMQIEAEITGDILNLDSELDFSNQSQSMQSFKNKLEEEREVKIKEEQAQQFERLEQLFGNTKSKELDILEAKARAEFSKKKSIFEEFKNQENTTPNQEQNSVIEDFFNNSPPKKEAAPKDKLKEDTLDDFFKKDDKQQQIDDFFDS